MSKRELLGTFKLGVDNVRLFSEHGDGQYAGAFVFQPTDGGTHKMVVGVGNRPWADVVSSVLHEAMEMCLHRSGCGHMRTQMPRETTHTYTFVASHDEFDRCCDWAGLFLVDCIPPLLAAWTAANRKQPKVKHGKK